ncbi:MAG: type II secretion system protein [Phycisphaeraceae bacterium]|nr:type II secretion system protein [Phycisphaeraceae bacterium]
MGPLTRILWYMSTFRVSFSTPGSGNRTGFTIIELLIVISLVTILIGFLMPAIKMAHAAVEKTVCASNLRQVGLAINMYTGENKDVFPTARHMPPPFLSADPDPPLNQLLRRWIDDQGKAGKVYGCPGDEGFAYARSGMSYQYEILIGGKTLEEYWPVKHMKMQPSELWIMRDFDGGEFDLDDGSELQVPAFQQLRNLLFADGHAGNFD